MGLFSRNVTKLDKVAPFDVNQMDEAIRDTVTRRRGQQHPRNLDEDEFIPSFITRERQPVEPPAAAVLIEQPQVITAGDIDKIGRITAETVKAASEASAAAFEALGKDMEDLVRRIEAMKLDALKYLEDLKEQAEQHREAGKLMSTKVELAAAEMSEVRDTIEAMRKKIASS